MNVKSEEGDQWLVESLAIGGISPVDRDDVTSTLASAEGQPFSEVNLAADRNSVLTYYYERGFDNADLKSTWEPSALPHHVNVIYTVTEGRREFVRDVITSGLRTTRQSLVDKLGFRSVSTTLAYSSESTRRSRIRTAIQSTNTSCTTLRRRTAIRSV